MEFLVKRTSTQWDDIKPCEEALRKQYIEKHDQGDKVVDAWSLEIDSMESLMMFIKKYGEVVLMERDYFSEADIPVLEIYDSYRE